MDVFRGESGISSGLSSHDFQDSVADLVGVNDVKHFAVDINSVLYYVGPFAFRCIEGCHYLVILLEYEIFFNHDVK